MQLVVAIEVILATAHKWNLQGASPNLIHPSAIKKEGEEKSKRHRQICWRQEARSRRREARSAGIEEESRRRKKIQRRISPILDRFFGIGIISRISRRESRQLSKISRRESRQLSRISVRIPTIIEIVAPSFSQKAIFEISPICRKCCGEKPNNYRDSRGNLFEIGKSSKKHSRVFGILDILAARTKKQ